jgi:hypothetical protein
VLQVTMKEGRKRQIRRVASKLGHPVQSLVRSHLATLALGDLKPGEWRYLDESEIKALKASAASGERLAKSAAARPPRQPGANSETREARRARKAAQPGSRTALRNANNEEHPRRTGTGRPASRSGSRTIGKPGGAARSGRKSGQPGRVLTNRPNPPKKRSGRRTRTE